MSVRSQAAVAAFLLAAALSPARPLTAAVLDFQARGVKKEEAQVLCDRFRVELFQRRGYRLLERQKMDEILKEQGFQKSGACEQSECAVEVGKLLGVNRMVIGNVSHIGSTWTVSARVVNVQTGEIVQSAVMDQRGEVDDLLQPGMGQLADKLREEPEGGDSAALPAGKEPVARPAGPGGRASGAAASQEAGGAAKPVRTSARAVTPLQVGVVPNFQFADRSWAVRGLALSLPWSRCAQVDGLQAGLVNQTDLGNRGIQAGVVNLGGASVGFLQAGAFNQAGSLGGLQAGAVNVASRVRGFQVGVVNFTTTLQGLQLGLINVALKGGVFPVMPLVNVSGTR